MNYRLFIQHLDDLTTDDLHRALAQLPEWRRTQALRFKFEQGQKECAFAYLLLCRALREVYGVEEQPAFRVGEHGKPSLVFGHTQPAHPIHFNLSHCRKAVACVVSEESVGVDVEQLGRYHEGVARHVLCPAEMDEVLSAPDPQLPFTRLWTQKEALVKLTGRGIDDDLQHLLYKYNNVSFHTEENTEQGYVLTVAQF